MSKTPEFELVSDAYEVLEHVQASLGDRPRTLGDRGACRYCGRTDSSSFRSIAHTFPEALGNKWVRSLDECDSCNVKFSQYESALVSGIGPFLTLGGVKGKNNKVRQTGRSSGPAYVRHSKEDGRRVLLTMIRDRDASFDYSVPNHLRLSFPIAEEPFRPRHAYKALSKMAFSLLPAAERPHYDQLRAWLLDVDDDMDFPLLEVGLAFAQVGNAPEVVTGTLLRRVNPNDLLPYILFVLTAGSVCLQIDLRSDHMEDHIPCSEVGQIKLRWTTHMQDAAQTTALRFKYSDPVCFNWSSRALEPQPIESMLFDFDPKTLVGTFKPWFRPTSLLIKG